MESTKRREVELSKLKKEAEEAAIYREAAIAQLRKKHNEANAELEQQIEASNHARQRWEWLRDYLYNLCATKDSEFYSKVVPTDFDIENSYHRRFA